VVDYDRCTNCLECLNFCLFGVYGLDSEGAIVAEDPDACRPGCPACARICPAAAIMFPEHASAAIAGDPEAAAEGLKLDLSQLFGGADPADLAAGERDRALADKRRQEAALRPDGPTSSPAKDNLDRLVDELDGLDL
jgi:NAD-dependent dihydropyrimidine dehydrogenase PreA subunit